MDVGPADILMPVDDIGLVAISHFFHVFLADSGYVLQMAQMDFKHIKFHFTSEF